MVIDAVRRQMSYYENSKSLRSTFNLFSFVFTNYIMTSKEKGVLDLTLGSLRLNPDLSLIKDKKSPSQSDAIFQVSFLPLVCVRLN